MSYIIQQSIYTWQLVALRLYAFVICILCEQLTACHCSSAVDLLYLDALCHCSPNDMNNRARVSERERKREKATLNTQSGVQFCCCRCCYCCCFCLFSTCHRLLGCLFAIEQLLSSSPLFSLLYVFEANVSECSNQQTLTIHSFALIHVPAHTHTRTHSNSSTSKPRALETQIMYLWIFAVMQHRLHDFHTFTSDQIRSKYTQLFSPFRIRFDVLVNIFFLAFYFNVDCIFPVVICYCRVYFSSFDFEHKFFVFFTLFFFRIEQKFRVCFNHSNISL